MLGENITEAVRGLRRTRRPALSILSAAREGQSITMEDLPHSTPEDVAMRLRALADGLTDPADIAAVNKYVDELEREAKQGRLTSKAKRLKDGVLALIDA